MKSNNLLIIDMQNGFINEYTCHLPEKIEKLQNDYENIYVVQFVNLHNSLFRTLLNWNSFDITSHETELAFNVKPNVRLYQKYTYGIPEGLLHDLKDFDIRDIDLCGIYSDACLLKSALDLFDAGIVPQILSNYSACSEGLDRHKKYLTMLRNLIGKQNII